MQNKSPLVSPPSSPAFRQALQNYRRLVVGNLFLNISKCLVNLFPFSKSSKIRIPTKLPKISKIKSRNVFGSDFDRLSDSFWHQVSLYFMTPRKLLFCNRYNVKRSALPLKPFHVGTNFRSTFDVFTDIFFRTPFFSPFV